MSSRRKMDVSSLEDVFLDVMEGRVSGREKLATASPAGEQAAAANGDLLEALVSPDKMTVKLRLRGMQPIASEDIFALLRRKGIVVGIDKAAVLVAVDRARHGEWKGDLVIARGQPPHSPWKIVYPFLEQAGSLGRDDCVWLVDGIPLASDLKRLLASSDINEFSAMGGLAVKMVKAGDVILRVVGDGEARPGMNVYGETVKAGEFPLEIGKNIRYDEAARQYVAEVFGYLQADGRQLAVLEPFWMSPDRMQVYYISLPTIGSQVVPEYQDISASLMRFQIRPKCIMQEEVKALCGKIGAGVSLPPVLVAAGLPPTAGASARVEYFFDTEIKAGVLREDDTIDLRERNAVVSTVKGEKIAEKILASKGTPGCDVMGREIPPEDGKDVPVDAGPGVVQKKEEGRIIYFAAIDGSIMRKGSSLSVVESCAIKGDVDYSTGNINVKTDIEIKGSVGPGFTVRSEGNIRIRDMVEAGAMVFAKGDLHVGKGIVGENTRVIAFGDIHAQFVQDAELIAKGSITIGSYMFNGLARAGGSVVVKKASFGGQGGKLAGGVVGGVVIASKGIEVSAVGSPTNRSTVVSLQADPVRVSEQKKMEEEIAATEEMIIKIMRTMQLDSVDPAAIRARLESVPAARREMFTKLLVNLSAMVRKKSQLENSRKALVEAMDKDLEKAAIRVSSEFFQGNLVQIGSKRYVTPNDLGPCTFQLKDGRIVN